MARCSGADGGQTAGYMLRRVNTTGEKGTWNETASATIGAQADRRQLRGDRDVGSAAGNDNPFSRQMLPASEASP